MNDRGAGKGAYHSRCPICKYQVLNHRFKLNGFTIVQCASCKLTFVAERLSQEELDHYYCETAGGENVDQGGVYLQSENVENLNYYYRKVRTIVRSRMQKGAILDIGCNAGYFLDLMGGFDCYGLDRSPAYCRRAKQRYKNHIFVGTFEEYAPKNQLFDCVTLQDVLDHMADPLQALKKCHTLLKQEGMLIIKVHDMSSLYARIMGRRFYAFVPPEHLFYFNSTAMAIALDKAGFRIESSTHIGHVMFLSTIFYRLAMRDTKSIFFRIYQLLDNTWLGNRKILKNLHDIITIVAVKKSD